MLLLLQSAAAASEVLSLCFGFPVLSFGSWSYSVYAVVVYCCICKVLFCFFCRSHLGVVRHLFHLFLFISICLFVALFHVLVVSFSLTLLVLSWHRLLCLLLTSTALQCSISVSWFSDQRACISRTL